MYSENKQKKSKIKSEPKQLIINVNAIQLPPRKAHNNRLWKQPNNLDQHRVTKPYGIKQLYYNLT